MKTLQVLIAAVLILTGIVWILQGINVLPGSFMTGRIVWAYIGAAAVLAGLILLALGGRLRGTHSPPEKESRGDED